jgi:hypothetical protein
MLYMMLGSPSLASLDSRVTMYHVNPLRFGPVPRNTDAADVVGDIFFDMLEVLSVPLACADPTIPASKKPFECKNLESTDPTDVLNKVTLDVDSRYSGYAMCNIGSVNGTDPMGRPCTPGGYCCYCSAPHEQATEQLTIGYAPSAAPDPHSSVPCNATVGLETLYSHWGPESEEKNQQPCFKDYDCWTKRSGDKLLTKDSPGLWYSVLEYGDCDEHPEPSPNCTWRVHSVDKIVNGTCHTGSFFGAVRKAAPEAFANCSKTVNTTDPCWVRGLYEAVLGPGASAPCTYVKVPYPPWQEYNCTYTKGGLPLEDIMGYWTAPFESEDPAAGGCPGLPIPQDARRTVSAQMRAKERARTESRMLPLSDRQRQWERFNSKVIGRHESPPAHVPVPSPVPSPGPSPEPVEVEELPQRAAVHWTI